MGNGGNGTNMVSFRRRAVITYRRVIRHLYRLPLQKSQRRQRRKVVMVMMRKINKYKSALILKRFQDCRSKRVLIICGTLSVLTRITSIMVLQRVKGSV